MSKICDTDCADVKELKPKAIIGFDGNTINGLIVHPNGKHVVYCMGNKITILEWATKKQSFLVGHTNIISSVCVSSTGKYIASGQINHIGFKARVIIWDFEQQKMISQHEHHKVRVEAVVFSKDERYLISLGGRDCGSVVIWDMKGGQVVCGAHVSRGVQGEATVLLPMMRRGQCFITGGDLHLAVWTIDVTARSVRSIDVAMTKLKRKVICMDGNERDEVLYCGTTTGDVMKVRLNFHHDMEILEPVRTPSVVGCFARITKKKLRRGSVDLYQQGVRAIRRLFSGELIIGAGDGVLELVIEAEKPVIPGDIMDVKMPSVPALKILKSTNVNSPVTSIQLMGEDTILVGTAASEIYQVGLSDFSAKLIVTCHTAAIYDITFPHDFSEVFASASHNNVRVWSMSTMQELLRITVQNFTCSSVVFTHDGKSILTAWNDGVIRSFTPLTGRLIYAILNAHNKGVSALATTSHGRMLISGGCEGQVRLWSVSPYRQQLICTLKEHKGPVSAIHINKYDTEAASASTDGTCIIWDLERQCRRQILFAKTLFLCVKYYPTGVQILTGGSDRKVAYWEVLDGCLVRELEGSPTGTINTLDISPSGEYFVTGGNDQIIKLWKYQEGVTTHIGLGHEAVITSVHFSANGKYIISGSAAGTIFIWECPQDEKDGKQEKETEKAQLENRTGEAGQVEENIRDLPTARSNPSSTSRSSHHSVHGEGCDCCNCCPPSQRSNSSGHSTRSNPCKTVCDTFSVSSNRSSKKDATKQEPKVEVEKRNSQISIVKQGNSKEGSIRSKGSGKGSQISTPKKQG
ncbi:cilia- and flagella-associated protein 52 [Anthonomus grandis grandis]|uniref:cilia- and flagella-associated protein 52 n=1 Tax=Anthonomus grandis grandis TaxID=2921223 RepID=UPI00216562A0|nr:cilia- and flagella-associated protein 52 [Anthonomus grandis grandis]